LQRTEGLLQASESLRRALLGNDAAALDGLLADEYCGFGPDGAAHDRAMMLEAYGPGGVQLLAYETGDVTTRLVGDVGLIMGVGVISGRYGDQAFSHRVRFLDVYVHRDARWQLFVSQVSELPREV
jgi:hypothetical protein